MKNQALSSWRRTARKLRNANASELTIARIIAKITTDPNNELDGRDIKQMVHIYKMTERKNG